MFSRCIFTLQFPFSFFVCMNMKCVSRRQNIIGLFFHRLIISASWLKCLFNFQLTWLMIWLDLGLYFDINLLFVSSHLFLCSILLSFVFNKKIVCMLLLVLEITMCISIYHNLLHLNTYFQKTIDLCPSILPISFHHDVIVMPKPASAPMYLSLKSYSLDYSRRKLGTHSRLLSLPYLPHLISNSC